MERQPTVLRTKDPRLRPARPIFFQTRFAQTLISFGQGNGMSFTDRKVADVQGLCSRAFVCILVKALKDIDVSG